MIPAQAVNTHWLNTRDGSWCRDGCDWTGAPSRHSGPRTTLGRMMSTSPSSIPAESVEARRAALIAELWPNNHCSYDELSDWAQAYVDKLISTEEANK